MLEDIIEKSKNTLKSISETSKIVQESIFGGYKLALEDLKRFERKGESYVREHSSEFGSLSYLYNPLRFIGGALCLMRHPIRGYKCIKKVGKKKIGFL